MARLKAPPEISDMFLPRNISSSKRNYYFASVPPSACLFSQVSRKQDTELKPWAKMFNPTARSVGSMLFARTSENKNKFG